MKTISSDTQTRIDKFGGEDPYCLLVIEGLGEILYFADRDTTIDGIEVEGRIMSHGDVKTQTRIDETVRTLGNFAVWNVTLSDNDERLRTLMQTNDIQGVTAKVYFVFEGQALSQATVLISGKIESPPEWAEGDRTLTFDVETPRRLDQIPYSPKESEGLDIDDDAVGNPWPLVYGDAVKDIEATLVKTAPEGVLVETIDQSATSFDVEDADEEFPQETYITIQVGDELMYGRFFGETFQVATRQVDRYPSIAVTGTGAEITVPDGVRAVGSYIEVGDGTFGGATPPRSLQVAYCYKQVGNVCHMWNGSSSFIIKAGYYGRVNRYPYLVSQGARWEHNSGTQVTLIAEDQVVYVANQIPSTAVYRVRAYRQQTDSDAGTSRRVLATVPTSLYTVKLSDSSYNGATTITMDEPLSARGAGWDDTIYVSLKSSVGSNPADIIEDVVTRFTDLTVDPESFATAQDLLRYDPMNFALARQGDALDIAAEIAWQARSAIVQSGDSVKLVYLASRPDQSEVSLSLTDEILAEDGIVESRTPRENVITVMRGLWRKNSAEEEYRKYTVETNVEEYGRREAEYDIFCYQKRSLVKRCIDFWAARRGNVWRIMTCRTFGLEALGVDPYDHVWWSPTGFYAQVPALVFSASTMDEECGLWLQLPIKSGEVTEATEFFTDDPTSGPDTPSIGTGTGEVEIIEAPPPDVIAPPKFPDVTYEAPGVPETVFNVVAIEDEERDAASYDFKKVRVRIVSPEETDANAQIQANTSRIAEIDFLDPDGVNDTLQAEREDLVEDSEQQVGVRDIYVEYSREVTAKNETVSFMLTGDKGTMIEVPGSYGIVTPSNVSGPFIASVSKKPASPAEGTLYADINLASQGGPTGTQEITILGDGSNIEVGDKLLVFRDSFGNYYSAAPGGGGGASMQVVTLDGTKFGTGSQVFNATYQDAEGEDVDVTVTILNINTSATLPSGLKVLATQIDGSWYGQVPLWL